MNQGANKQEEPWPALGDRSIVSMVDQLFVHLLKAINICAHVIDDVTPGPVVKVRNNSITIAVMIIIFLWPLIHTYCHIFM